MYISIYFKKCHSLLNRSVCCGSAYFPAAFNLHIFFKFFSFAARKKKSSTWGGGKLSRPVGRISRKKTQEELWLYFPDFSLSVDVFPWPCYVLCWFFGRRPEGKKKYLDRDETIETNYTKKAKKS